MQAATRDVSLWRLIGGIGGAALPDAVSMGWCSVKLSIVSATARTDRRGYLFRFRCGQVYSPSVNIITQYVYIKGSANMEIKLSSSSSVE